MSRKQGHERCHGPFPHGKRWRVVIVGADGSREYAKESDEGPSSFATEEAANAYIQGFRSAVENRTIGEAVTAFIEATSIGKKNTDDKARYALTGLLRLLEGDRLLTTLKTAVAVKLVKQRAAEVAYETARIELGYATRFARWCVEQGWLRINPFIETKLEKKERSVGKAQLRVDEVRKFLAHVQADTSKEATAVLMTLLMGLRAHEVVERTVRDLDDNGRLLVIGKSKTKAGERTVGVPSVLRGRLLELARGRGPNELLFDKPTNPRKATNCTRHWLLYWVLQFSKDAGVPRVTAHGMRGTFASMTVAAGLPTGPGSDSNQKGLTVRSVATMLGHTSADVTRRHYMAPGVEQSAAVSAVEGLLGTDGSNEFPDDLEDVNSREEDDPSN